MGAAAKLVPIGALVEKIRTWNPARESESDTFRYIDIASVSQSEKRIIPNREVPVGQAPSRARQLVEEGDVLVSTVRPNLNTVAYVSEEMHGATASTGFCVLRPKSDKIHGRFLFHWVQSPRFVADLVKQATGQSYPAVSDKIIKETCLPLPHLDEQRRIAAILDQASLVRRLRLRSVEKISELSQSIFYEIFGDPLTNPNKWPDDRQLGEVAEIVSGITKGRKPNRRETREVPYLAVINVQDRFLRLSPLKTIDATNEEINKYKLEVDDLLLTEGGDPDKLGRGTIWQGELPTCIHQNHVFRIRLRDTSVRPIFLNWLIGSKRGKAYFLRSAKQTTGIASINKTQLRNFPLLLPPIDLQKEFEQWIVVNDRLQKTMDAALQEKEALFLSLQQRAFRGEL